MDKLKENQLRLAALCKRMGDLWSEDEVTELDAHILVLLEGDPNTSEHCYDFSHNAFWVHILGLPRARINEDSVRNIASKLGKVEKVQLEARNSNSFLLLMWSNWALCQLLP